MTSKVDKDSIEKNRDSQILLIAISAACIVVVLWLVVAIVALKIWLSGSPENMSKVGQFGDIFGSINALFSGLAFAGVIIALLFQRNELKLQHKELVRSVKAQQETATAQQARLSFEKDLEKKRKSIDLYNLWQGSKLFQARRDVQRWLVDIVGVEKLPKKADELKQHLEEHMPKLSELRQKDDEIYLPAYQIINFFEKWALLNSVEEIDDCLLQNLMGSHPIWWDNCFLTLFMLREGNTDQQLTGLIQFIKAYALNYDKSQHWKWPIPRDNNK